MLHASLAIAVVALSVGSAWAQEEADPARTAVSVVGGLSVGSAREVGFTGGRFLRGEPGSDSGVAVGGSVAHDFSSRFTVEATGLYLDRAAGAWSADAGVRLNLLPSGRPVVPYFGVTGGIYSERLETLGGALRVRPGDGRNALVLRPTGNVPPAPGRTGSPLPFGRSPVTVDREPARDRADGSRQNDALLTLGGGVRFAAGPHVFVRPDLRAQVVFAGDTRVLGLFTLNFGYRF